MIGLVYIAHKYLNLNAILSFCIAYILTWPLSASIGDFLSQPQKNGGVGLGTAITSGIFLAAIIAYPYGGLPKDKIKLRHMKEIFQLAGIKIAFRIGDKLNPYSPVNRYELKRIDITGNDSFRSFKAKLKNGRIKLF